MLALWTFLVTISYTSSNFVLDFNLFDLYSYNGSRNSFSNIYKDNGKANWVRIENSGVILPNALTQCSQRVADLDSELVYSNQPAKWERVCVTEAEQRVCVTEAGQHGRGLEVANSRASTEETNIAEWIWHRSSTRKVCGISGSSAASYQQRTQREW